MALQSLQVEKHVVGGLIQNINTLADVARFVSEKDFVAEPHGVIYSCLLSSFLNQEKIDKVLLAQKIKNLGISFKDKISIFDYIDALCFSPITPAATIDACKELVKYRALRDINAMCDNVKKHLENNLNNNLTEIVADVDKLYGERMHSFEIEDEPDDLFSGVYELVEERGNNPLTEMGFSTPYPEFNRLYGGLRNGNVYAIASRAGQGKTSWLNHLACETGRIHNIPVLILDTEMTSSEIKFRNAASFTGVPLWYLETGMWRKDPAMVEKIRKSLKGLDGKYKAYHYYVGNKSIDTVMSIVRRWYYKVVGRGNPCVIVYDYLKLTGEKLSQNWAEHQALGEKVDKIKQLAVELQVPIVTAIQLNRSGEGGSKKGAEMTDDATAIALSDRLTWFGTYIGIFRRKTQDEMLLDTVDSGTHKLIEIKARYQGKDAAGHHDQILRTMPDGSKKFFKNYINFSVKNFHVEERGSLKDSIIRQNAKFLVSDAAPKITLEEDDVTL
jgi:replicative DNA helicase